MSTSTQTLFGPSLEEINKPTELITSNLLTWPKLLPKPTESTKTLAVTMSEVSLEMKTDLELSVSKSTPKKAFGLCVLKPNNNKN